MSKFPLSEQYSGTLGVLSALIKCSYTSLISLHSHLGIYKTVQQRYRRWGSRQCIPISSLKCSTILIYDDEEEKKKKKKKKKNKEEEEKDKEEEKEKKKKKKEEC